MDKDEFNDESNKQISGEISQGEIGVELTESKSEPIPKMRLAEFELDPRFKSIKTVGYGDYGFLAIALDLETHKKVAVRKSYNVFRNLASARELARELCVLRQLGHPNVECLIDVFSSPCDEDFQDLFVVTRMMDKSLAALLHFNPEQVTYKFMQDTLFQILCGLKHIHSANVVHRDLKTVSILLKENGLLQIANFQAALNIGEVDVENDGFVGHSYESSSSNRSPEMILKHRFLTPAADIWGLGCCMWELLGGDRLFSSSCELNSIMKKIMRVTGLDPIELGYTSEDALIEYLQRTHEWPDLPENAPFDFDAALPAANPQGKHLLRRMLKLDPKDRISVAEIMADSFVIDVGCSLHAEMDRECNHQIDLRPFSNSDLEKSETINLMLQEILLFKQFQESETADSK